MIFDFDPHVGILAQPQALVVSQGQWPLARAAERLKSPRYKSQFAPSIPN